MKAQRRQGLITLPPLLPRLPSLPPLPPLPPVGSVLDDDQVLRRGPELLGRFDLERPVHLLAVLGQRGRREELRALARDDLVVLVLARKRDRQVAGFVHSGERLGIE